MATTDKGETRDAKAESKTAVKLAAVPAAPAAAAVPVPVPRTRDVQRDKAIDVAVSTIEKQFGKGSIMRLGEDATAPEVQVVPTGSLGLDIALGVGGVPAGAPLEI